VTIVESRLRNGVLTVGTAPDTLDISCQLTNVRMTAAYSDDGDAVETLCGDKIAAGEKADGYTVAGTFIQDWTATPEDESAIWWLWDHQLDEVDFTYTPNPEGPTLHGRLRVKLPAEFLGGDVNVRLSSDFEWTVTTDPTRTPPTAMATGATAGTPGTWTPAGRTAPANAAGATSAAITASPTTAWTVGQYVQGSTAGTPGEMHWTGTAWATGKG
jgi:hypothetical protein